MSVEERAADIKTRLRSDMLTTFREHAVTFDQYGELSAFLDALMEDALHQIEPLLLEINQCMAVARASGDRGKWANCD